MPRKKSSLEGGKKRRRRSVSKKSSRKGGKKSSGGKRASGGKKRSKKTGLKRQANPVFLAHVDLRKFMAKELGVKQGKQLMKFYKIYVDQSKKENPNASSMEIVKFAKEIFKKDPKAKSKYESSA
jgi:uncharacterized short protein YbdD (DUF466 family)